MYIVWMIIVGVAVALLSQYVVFKTMKPYLGLIALIIVDIIGAWLGDLIFGDWALVLNGFNIIGGIIGAIILDLVWLYLVSPYLFKATQK